MRQRYYFLILLILISTNVYSQNYDSVVLNSAHVRILKSDIIEDTEYILNIALPPGYQDTTLNYPVVYMLDAYEIFGLQLQTYQQLIFFETVPPMILVGINYKVQEQDFYKGLQEYLYIRSRDFTPTSLTHEQIVEKHGKGFASYFDESGGAEKFLRFLQEELFPFIDSEYRSEPNDRGLLSYSLGGLFSTYVLFYAPTTFQKYFIGSPALWWDDQVVFDIYDDNKFTALNNPVKVYLSVGENESKGLKNSWRKLKDFIESKDNTNILLQTETLSGEYHLTGIGLAHSRAFRRLYGNN
jgi:predicted alpha/beta superfamily hydrolase